jgi:hypothetical protein
VLERVHAQSPEVAGECRALPGSMQIVSSGDLRRVN